MCICKYVNYFFQVLRLDVTSTFTNERRHFRLTDFSPSPGLFWASVQNVGQCFDVKSSISPFFSNVGVHGFEWEVYYRQSTMTVVLCSLVSETLNGLLGSRSRIEAQRRRAASRDIQNQEVRVNFTFPYYTM